MTTCILTTSILLLGALGFGVSSAGSLQAAEHPAQIAQSSGNVASHSIALGDTGGGTAKVYTIHEREDISMKAITKSLSAYEPGEVARLPRNVRMVYRVLVSSDISGADLGATLIQLVEDETSRDPDIDEIVVFAYDRKEDVEGVYTFAKLEWCPNGDWAGVTPEIARTNDRSTYKYNIDIKEKVGDLSGRPTEREFEIYTALEKTLWASPDASEDEIDKNVAAHFSVSVKELNDIWLKVTSYQLK